MQWNIIPNVEKQYNCHIKSTMTNKAKNMKKIMHDLVKENKNDGNSVFTTDKYGTY